MDFRSFIFSSNGFSCTARIGVFQMTSKCFKCNEEIKGPFKIFHRCAHKVKCVKCGDEIDWGKIYCVDCERLYEDPDRKPVKRWKI